ncbi:MAG: TIGR03086 family metal-binding protein [Acidimicrobiales bacterium]
MSNEPSELPVFPTSAPAAFSDPDAASGLFAEVLDRLTALVDVDVDQLQHPTPCAGFTVDELRNHVLGWLQFFAAALSDPAATSPRPDPEAFTLADGQQAGDVVARALADIHRAIAADAARQMVTMSSSRMAGDGVLGMALGEYIIHAWDLATATGKPYSAPDTAVTLALAFLQETVAPEYRGPDSGFFDEVVPVPDGASPLDELLGFAGRDPHWSPSA